MSIHMKEDCNDLTEKSSQNLWATLARCLIAFLMLTHGCKDGLAAIRSELSGAGSNTVSGQQATKSRRSNTKTPRQDGKQAPDSSGQVMPQESEPQFTNPLELLKMALEANSLGASLTKEGVTEAIKKYKAAFFGFQSQDIKIGMAATLFACGTGYYFLT